LADVREDRMKRVIVTGLTPVFSADECFPTGQQRITTIMPVDGVSVRQVRYPKECMTVKVRLKSGQEGFLVSGEGQWSLE
jgi:hypothetical protein